MVRLRKVDYCFEIEVLGVDVGRFKKIISLSVGVRGEVVGEGEREVDVIHN